MGIIHFFWKFLHCYVTFGSQTLKKKLENLKTQLEKNVATDFEKNRNRPSNKLAGMKKNVFWRIAYGDEVPAQEELEDAVTRQLRPALRREPADDTVYDRCGRCSWLLEQEFRDSIWLFSIRGRGFSR